jgi:hypothetical protein
MAKKQEASSVDRAALEAALRAPLDPKDVSQRKGPGGSKLDYVSGGYVKARLFELAGPLGWSAQMISPPVLVGQPVGETRRKRGQDGKDRDEVRWSATAMATVRVLLGDPSAPLAYHDDVGTCTSQDQVSVGEALELAVKGAATDALKRAAAPFGPSLGLALLVDDDAMMKEEEKPARPPATAQAPSSSGETARPTLSSQESTASGSAKSPSASAATSPNAGSTASASGEPRPTPPASTSAPSSSGSAPSCKADQGTAAPSPSPPAAAQPADLPQAAPAGNGHGVQLEADLETKKRWPVVSLKTGEVLDAAADPVDVATEAGKAVLKAVNEDVKAALQVTQLKTHWAAVSVTPGPAAKVPKDRIKALLVNAATQMAANGSARGGK